MIPPTPTVSTQCLQNTADFTTNTFHSTARVSPAHIVDPVSLAGACPTPIGSRQRSHTNSATHETGVQSVPQGQGHEWSTTRFPRSLVLSEVPENKDITLLCSDKSYVHTMNVSNDEYVNFSNDVFRLNAGSPIVSEVAQNVSMNLTTASCVIHCSNSGSFTASEQGHPVAVNSNCRLAIGRAGDDFMVGKNSDVLLLEGITLANSCEKKSPLSDFC